MREHLAHRLPAYAGPKFLRLAGAIAATGTFKHSKTELQREGYDPAATADAIYVDDLAAMAYMRLDAGQHACINAGKLRF